MRMSTKPVLLIGGYGVTGSAVARLLRARHPDLPLAVAGRDLEKAKAAARALGGTEAFRVDLNEGAVGLGLPHADFSAVVVLLKDETLDAMSFAERHGVGYVNVANGAFESCEEFLYGLAAGKQAAVAIAGHWFCGAVVLAALKLCEGLAKVDKIHVGIVVDRAGAGGGPAVTADFERIFRSCPSTMLRTGGRYQWVSGDAAKGRFTGVDGIEHEGTVAVSLDCLSLGAATGARDVQVLELFGVSSTRQKGGAAADEISIVVEGRDASGTARTRRQDIVAPRDGTSPTTLFIAMIVERMTGLDGGPAAAGVYMPEGLLSPSDAVAQMQQAGMRFSSGDAR